MNDLVDQFEDTLNGYRNAVQNENVARYYGEAADILTWVHEREIMAIKLADFLLEHGPTVTFDAPAEPSAAAFEPQYVWDDERRNWFPKEGADDGC